MTIKFKLKRPSNSKSVILVEFKKNNQNYKFYTGKTIHSKNWSIKEEVKSGEENYQLINQYLTDWKNELKKIIAETEINKQQLIQEVVQSKLNSIFNQKTINEEETKITDFISFMDEYIESKKVKKREIQKLQQTKKLVIVGFKLISNKHLLEYNKLSSSQKSATILKADFKLPFRVVTLNFIEDFRNYLYTAKYHTKVKDVDIMQNYKINYIDKQVKGLKQFISAAIEAKYVERFTWNNIKSEEREVDSIYTDFEEIQAIYDTNLTKPTEILVRDKYVFNCFLGLRYSDLNKIEPHVFKKRNILNKEYIVYSGRAQKTDQKVEFALHPIAVQIIEKYNYNLPKLSAKEFNEVIKTVAVKAGLTQLERIREIRAGETIIKDIPKNELMCSHSGRRSFCTNFYVEGVSIAAIMSISGHSTEKEFRKYVKKTSVRLEVVADQVFAIKGINHLRVA